MQHAQDINISLHIPSGSKVVFKMRDSAGAMIGTTEFTETGVKFLPVNARNSEDRKEIKYELLYKISEIGF